MLGHSHIGTEHLLLGILRGNDPVAELFAKAGISLDAARAEIEAIVGRGHERDGHLPFTRDAKHVLELSLREAMAVDQDFITPAHIALALIDERAGHAAKTARALGADLDDVRNTLADLVVGEGAAPGGREQRIRYVSRAMSESRPTSAAAPEPARLRAERDLLADALRRYGSHAPGCPGGLGACSCGLDQLLAIAEDWPEQP
jgi:ATP-dependent Clp protease ATP-binding subunit ClpA